MSFYFIQFTFCGMFYYRHQGGCALTLACLFICRRLTQTVRGEFSSNFGNVDRQQLINVK